jgi:quercetin dioxygenase-like cupin family protein
VCASRVVVCKSADQRSRQVEGKAEDSKQKTSSRRRRVGTIVFRHAEELTATRASDHMTAEQLARFGDGEARALRRNYFPADQPSLELFEITLEPDAEVRPHGHSQAEIIYVVAGELRFGARVCAPGSAVFVEAETLYGFSAGPEGATFVNFRSSPGTRYFFADELRARRAGTDDRSGD